MSYNEIKMYYLHNDYEKRTELIHKLSLHIEHLYDIFLITSDDRKKALTMLNNLLNELNTCYNSYIIENNPNIKSSVKKLNDEIDDLNNSIIIENENFTEINKDWQKNSEIKASIKILDILRKNNSVRNFIKDLTLANFEEIDKSLRRIVNFVGIKNISDILFLYKFDISHLNDENKEK